MRDYDRTLTAGKWSNEGAERCDEETASILVRAMMNYSQ